MQISREYHNELAEPWSQEFFENYLLFKWSVLPNQLLNNSGEKNTIDFLDRNTLNWHKLIT